MQAMALLGANLRRAMKARFPNDDLRAFSIRVGCSRATLQKMLKGDGSVALGKYLEAAQLLGVTTGFENLFTIEPSLFDD